MTVADTVTAPVCDAVSSEIRASVIVVADCTRK